MIEKSPKLVDFTSIWAAYWSPFKGKSGRCFLWKEFERGTKKASVASAHSGLAPAGALHWPHQLHWLHQPHAGHCWVHENIYLGKKLHPSTGLFCRVKFSKLREGKLLVLDKLEREQAECWTPHPVLPATDTAEGRCGKKMSAPW